MPALPQFGGERSAGDVDRVRMVRGSEAALHAMRNSRARRPSPRSDPRAAARVSSGIMGERLVAGNVASRSWPTRSPPVRVSLRSSWCSGRISGRRLQPSRGNGGRGAQWSSLGRRSKGYILAQIAGAVAGIAVGPTPSSTGSSPVATFKVRNEGRG
jgi:hypothetical protein